MDRAGSISLELAPYISIDGAGSISIWSWLHINLELAPYRYGSWLHINLELAPYRYGAGSISMELAPCG